MPVTYIDVQARSEMFVPASRAYGTIAIIGKGRATAAASPPKAFTDPGDARSHYSSDGRSFTDGVLNGTTSLGSAAGAAFTQGDVGRPVSGRGIAEDTTITTVTSATAVVLSKPATATATGVSVTLGRTPPSDLEAAIAIAFRQSPPPVTIWGIQVADTPDWDTALTATSTLDVQIVVLANTPLSSSSTATIAKLANHVSSVSGTGGDGKERIGVVMLDPTLNASAAAALNVGSVSNERLVLIAHKSKEDAAAAFAGVIAGYEPHISLLLKPIRLNQTASFTAAEIDTFDKAFVNWVTSPVLLPGSGTYLGEAYTANPSQGNKKYIDIVRTLDDVNFRVKAALIRAIGNLRISRSGLRAVQTIVESTLSPLVGRQVIEGYAVVIKLLVLLDRDPATLSAEEHQQIQAAQASRNVDMTVTVDYAGAIHRLHVDLVFT